MSNFINENEVVAGAAAVDKVLLQNSGIKQVSGLVLAQEAINPAYVYFITESKMAVVFHPASEEGAEDVWFGLDGYIAAGSTTARNSYPKQYGQLFYNTTTNKVEVYKSGGWFDMSTGGVFAAEAYIQATGLTIAYPGNKYLAMTSSTVFRILNNPNFLPGHMIEFASYPGWISTDTFGARVVGLGTAIKSISNLDGTIQTVPYVIINVGLVYQFIKQPDGSWMSYTNSNFQRTTIWDTADFDGNAYVSRASRSALGESLDEVADAAGARVLLNLGSGATANVGTGTTDIPINAAVDQKLAPLQNLVNRGVTATTGKLVAEGYAGAGIITTLSNLDAAVTGNTTFISAVNGSPVDNLAVAGVSVRGGSSETNTFTTQIVGRDSRFFGRTAEAATVADWREFLTIPGLVTNNKVNPYGLDADNYRSVGTFSVTSTVAKLPVAVDGTLKVGSVVTPEGGFALTQEFLPYSASTPRHYFRSAKAGTFSDWASALLTAGLGTAAALDAGEEAGNVQLVGAFGGPTGAQVYWHSGNTLNIGATAATARTAMGLGSLAILNALPVAQITGILPIANGGTGGADAAAARANLGLGSMALLNAINNANWQGTALAIANGGTGAITAPLARTNLGLGTAAILDAQTNAGDTAGNRLSLVGAFGPGSTSGIGIGSTASFDATNIPGGLYRITSSNPGTAPFGLTDFNLIVARYNATDSTQIAMGIYGDFYHRSSAGGVWGAWKAVFSFSAGGTPSVTDCNGALNTGFYEISNGVTTNVPSAGSGILIHINRNTSSTSVRRIQIAIINGRLHTRADTNGTYSEWQTSLNYGDYGIGTSFRAGVGITATTTPENVLTSCGGASCLYTTGVLAMAGGPAGSSNVTLKGYITSANNYSYSYQIAHGVSGFDMWVRNAASATAWGSWRRITIASTVSPPTAGTYPVVTIDAQGLVTSGRALLPSDVPTLNQNTTGSSAKLETARTIAAAGDIVWNVSFDGASNVTAVATLANSGVTAGAYTKVSVDAKGRVTGGSTLVAGDVPTLNQNTTGNAATATKLITARSIAATGDVIWSVSFDGNANVTAAATLSNTGVTPGVFTRFAVDAKGRITSAALLDIADLPASGVAAGTYPKVTVNSKGQVISGSALSAGDIPIELYRRSNIGAPVTGTPSAPTGGILESAGIPDVNGRVTKYFDGSVKIVRQVTINLAAGVGGSEIAGTLAYAFTITYPTLLAARPRWATIHAKLPVLFGTAQNVGVNEAAIQVYFPSSVTTGTVNIMVTIEGYWYDVSLT